MQYSVEAQIFTCDTQQEANLLGGQETWGLFSIGVLANRISGLGGNTVDPTGLSHRGILAAQARLDAVRDHMLDVVVSVAAPMLVSQCEHFLGQQVK